MRWRHASTIDDKNKLRQLAPMRGGDATICVQPRP